MRIAPRPAADRPPLRRPCQRLNSRTTLDRIFPRTVSPGCAGDFFAKPCPDSCNTAMPKAAPSAKVKPAKPRQIQPPEGMMPAALN